MGHMFGGGGRGSDFCVTQNFYHLTQSETMDSEVFPLLLGQYVMFSGHSNMHGSYVWGRGGGGLVTFV